MATPLDLDGQVAIVTGAARGLGRTHALTFARRGARVLAVDLLDCGEVVAEIGAEGGTAQPMQVDLADDEAATRVLDRALAVFGDVDVLVNNAGLVRDRMSFNICPAEWRLVLDVNLSATFFLSQAAVRHWRASGRGGAIVNTSSESGLYGNAGQANYAAAKAGVAALTLTLASELHRSGIRVNAIAPRARTPMSDSAFGDLPREDAFDPFGAEHVSEVVAWLASEAAVDVTGQVLVVHGRGVEVMNTWTTHHRIERDGGWSERELLELRDALFPDGDTRRLVEPVSALFVSPKEKKEKSSDGANG